MVSLRRLPSMTTSCEEVPALPLPRCRGLPGGCARAVFAARRSGPAGAGSPRGRAASSDAAACGLFPPFAAASSSAAPP